MKNYMSVACLALMALLHICSGQRTVFGLLSGSNTLIKFNSANPGSIMATVPISGLTGDAVGMDFRPFNGALYVLTTGGGVYTVNTQTGVATLSTTLAGCTIAAGTVYSIDFNPTVDLLRIISSGGANYRANVVNGTCLTDGTIFVPNGGPLPSIFGVAYTNSFRGAGSTVLYALDASTLGTVTVPNTGAYEFTRNTSFTTVAPVGFDSVPATVINGGDQLLWASLTVNGVTGLYAISTSGAATAVGTIGTGAAALRAIAISLTPIAVTAYAVTTANQLVRIDTEDSSSVIPVTVTGLAAGDIMLGVDFRLSDQRLYAVTAGTAGSRVYVINVLTYVATQVGANLNGCTFSTVTTVFFGVDWNPRVNQLRVVDSTGNNFRINVETSTCVVEGNINLSQGGTAPVISAVAYTNNTAAFVNTTLRAFDLGAVPPTFGTLSPPALGEYTASGPLTVAVPTSGPASFDIFGTDNTGLATVVIDTVSYLVTVNTGDGTLGFIAQPGAVNIKSLSVSFSRVPMTPSPTGFYPTAVVLTATAPQQAISVSTSAVGTVITSAPITNLTAGTTLLGMDLRPSNQRVVGISSDSKIYIIDLTTAIAYQVTTMSCTLPTTAGIVYALDFNPVADLLRIVSSTGANYRVNVDNGTCIIDGNLQYTDNTTPQAVGVAYTNSTAGATGTQEYILDQNNNGFAQVTNPNGGATSLRGTVGINIFPNPPTVDVAGSTPLDILTVNSVQWAFAVIANTLYDVNIATGSLRTYGYITTPSPIIGLTILPEGYVPPAPPVINATTATSTTTTTSTGTTTGTSTGTGTGTTGTAPTAGAGASSTTSSASSVLISFFVIALVLAIHF